MAFQNLDNEQDNVRTFLNNLQTVLGSTPTQAAAIASLTVTPTSGALPTADGAITVANTATPTVVELLEFCVEINTKLDAVLAALRAHGLIDE